MKILLPIFLIAFPFFLMSESIELKLQGEEALFRGEFKEAIACFQQLIKTDRNLSESQVLLTLAYLKDQQHDLAFKTFIEALETAPKREAAVSAKEKELYEEAKALYLEKKGIFDRESASKIRQRFAPILELHPEYLTLSFFVALAYACLNQLEEFFPLFYRAYCVHPNHYLAYKTKAILGTKLFERLPVGDEKERVRKDLLENLATANEMSPEDTVLYRIMVLYTPGESLKETIEACLNKMIHRNIMVPRNEVSFFLSAARDHGLEEQAEKLIALARNWYPYSRALTLTLSE